MTDLNTSHHAKTKKDTDTKQSLDQNLQSKQTVDNQQVSIKSWSQKLLVVILCAASFYGGWKSYESNMVNECTANGGQMVDGQKTMICQRS
ncbi:hypothetical protein [Psychrobacter sp. Ps6]|uniref:hypothetical protein n=1 Tax=Psychrobacter sp. Ps6 TaxID=2790960 RepID=UPI001EDF0483|nr:hypothetical protein [Psychrobacter sp. Ps6]MCG3879539.1 hypothetical protein [Psychrobacter sp. Ps6]